MITRENYQVLVEDFIAGNLKPEIEEAFILFLEENPDLADFSMEEESLPAMDSKFLSGLKKDLVFDENNLDEVIIAQLEGDLAESESTKLDDYLAKNEDKDRERRLYMHTLLRPALNESFGDKTPLYRKAAFVLPRFVWYSGAIAAGLAIFALLYTNQPEDKSLGFVPEKVEVKSETKVQSEVKSEMKSPSTEPEKATPLLLKQSKPSRLITFPSLDTDDRPELKIEEQIPSLQASINPELNTGNDPQLAMSIEPISIAEGEEFLATEKQSMSLLQFAYQRIRKSIVEDDKVIAEEEIPKDAASILVAKVKPLISYDEENDGVSFKLGSLEFKRNKRK